MSSSLFLLCSLVLCILVCAYSFIYICLFRFVCSYMLHLCSALLVFALISICGACPALCLVSSDVSLCLVCFYISRSAIFMFCSFALHVRVLQQLCGVCSDVCLAHSVHNPWYICTPLLCVSVCAFIRHLRSTSFCMSTIHSLVSKFSDWSAIHVIIMCVTCSLLVSILYCSFRSVWSPSIPSLLMSMFTT